MRCGSLRRPRYASCSVLEAGPLAANALLAPLAAWLTHDGLACLLLQVITWVFIIEMAVKVLGLGCVRYWSDGCVPKIEHGTPTLPFAANAAAVAHVQSLIPRSSRWNQLDGIIVSMSIFEMLATAIERMIEASGGGVSNVSFLRMLRLLRLLRVARVLRLMRAWQGLHTILSTFVEVVPQMANIFILIFLTIFTFALFGMQMFGGVITQSAAGGGGGDGAGADEPNHPDAVSFNFDYCGQAMVAVFIVLTGEWCATFLSCHLSCSPSLLLSSLPLTSFHLLSPPLASSAGSTSCSPTSPRSASPGRFSSSPSS